MRKTITFIFPVFFEILFVCISFCSCVWNDNSDSPLYLPLDDSEFPYAGLPRLVIETEDFAQISDRETNLCAKLQIYGENSPESDVLDLEIKGRGNSSFTMAKYSIKLKFENKQSLFGMPKDKEWDLVANHRDKSMLRNYITYQLAHTLHDGYSPRNQFVEVFLNRKYMGVYMLVEHIKVSPQRVKIYEDDSSFLFEKTSATATGENLITTDMGYIYDICYPKNPSAQIKENLKSHLNSFENFLQSKTVNNTDSLRNGSTLTTLFATTGFKNFHTTPMEPLGGAILSLGRKDYLCKWVPFGILTLLTGYLATGLFRPTLGTSKGTVGIVLFSRTSK